ncbi:hypothetical protein VTN31DRAFT_3199 [Thermomyces dupontii]|uniref:uncharacterized protein n=1 Tax=Talaromyces thermophilus TaxID=28565 RepID=UPI00374365F5
MHTDAKQTTEIPFWPTGVRVEKTRVVMFNSSTIWSSHSFISVWDLSSNQVHEIGSLRRVWLWHMEVDRNELVTFEINWRKRPLKVQQTKGTLTGRRLDRKHFHLSLPDRIQFPLPRLFSDQSTFGHKTVSRLSSGECPEFAMMDLMNDYTTDKLDLRWIDRPMPLKTEYFDDLSRTLTPYISYHWNCRRNRLDICNAATGTTTMHPYQLDRREVYTHKVARSYSRRPKHPPGSPALFALYVVSCFNRHEHLVSHDGIQIWYFDPKLEPPRAFAWRGFRANNGGRSLNLRDDLMIQDHLTVN